MLSLYCTALLIICNAGKCLYNIKPWCATYFIFYTTCSRYTKLLCVRQWSYIVTSRSWCSRNPSAGSLVLSETGSLDRAKAAYERRKKNQVQESDMATVPGRVEITRVNPDDLIEELLKNTNLEQADDSAESKIWFHLRGLLKKTELLKLRSLSFWKGST